MLAAAFEDGVSVEQGARDDLYRSQALGKASSVNGPRRFDAVVFDLLTALIDSWTLWNRAAGSASDVLRWRRAYLELTYAAGLYRPYEDIVRQAAGLARVDASCANTLFAEWNNLPPWPETRQVLAALADRVPLGVVTNCSRTLGAAAVACTGERFAAFVTAESAGFYKPRPEPYDAVLKRLGTNPERTLFVAGSAADVPGAKGAGMPVYWHNRMGLQPVDHARPDFGAANLEPLLELVSRFATRLSHASLRKRCCRMNATKRDQGTVVVVRYR